LGFRSKEILMRCVKQYLTSSAEFDSRPGLKFLIQKVSNIDFAANLYKQMISSWMTYYVVLVDSYLSDIRKYNLNIEDLKYIVESCSKTNLANLKKKEQFVRHMFALQDIWNMVSEQFLNNINVHNIESIVKQDENKENENDENTDKINLANADNEDSKVENNNNNEDIADKNMESKSSNPEETTTSVVKTPEKVYLDRKNSLEENIPMTTLVTTNLIHRTNPFDTIKLTTTTGTGQPTMATIITETSNNPVLTSGSANNESQAPVPPEIEQQRATSILRDQNYKKSALSQLVVASMELLQSLPDESGEYLKLLRTGNIQEALRQVQLQGNELKLNLF